MRYKDFLAHTHECPFCHLKQEEIVGLPDAFMTFALAPYHEHQLLVVPRRHTEEYLDLSTAEVRDVDLLLKQGVQILKYLGYANYSILLREGEASFKSIPHLHFNIIPCDLISSLNHKGEERSVLEDFEKASLLSSLIEAKKALAL